MNMARSTFYKRPNAEHAGGREKADADLRVRIEDILAEFPSYGYRRITHELRRRGQLVNHKRVSRVMREHALTPRRVRAWLATTNSKHKQPVYPNLRCSITPVGPDELWVADLTYIRLTTGFVFLAVVLDAWSRRVIGYAISHLLDTRLCLAALDAALDLRRPRAGLVHHSDRGVQGGFKRSSQHLKKRRSCDGGKQAPTVGSSFTSADGFTRSSPVGAPGASAEVLGGSCSRAVEREVGGGSRRVSRCWRALVSPMWWHATFQSSSFVGALPIVRRARRDCGSSCWRLRRARDRPAVGPLTVDDLARTAAERSNTKWKPRVSSHSRPMACRSTSETSESCQTRCKQRTEAVCAGSPRRPDRGSRRGGRAGPKCTLGRASPWSPTRPAVGGLVESRADRQQATGRLSR